MKLDITINGTDSNPWHVYGLTQNPFPQLARAEYDMSCLRLQALGGDPVPDTNYIRTHLRGYVSDELIELCCQQFKKGEQVKFRVFFEE